MTRILTTLVALTLGTALTAEPVRVVTGTAPAQGLTMRVMDGVGAPTMILPVGADAHSYSMRPSEARALGGAQLVVWIGGGHAPWLEGPIEELARGAQVLELMAVEGLHVLTYGEDHDAHGHETHAHGDDAHDHDHEDHAGDDHAHDHDDHAHDDHAHDDHAHGDHDHDHAHDDHAGHAHAHSGSDTHAWLDPENAILWMNAVADALSMLDPDNAPAYAANAEAGAQEIRAAAAETEARIEALGEVHLVTAHESFNYFADSFDIEIIGTIGDSHARSPGAARIAELRALVADHDRVCVLTERTTSIGFVDALEVNAAAQAEPNGLMGEIGADFIPALYGEIASGIEACFSAS